MLFSLPATELFCMNSERERLCKVPQKEESLQRRLPKNLRAMTGPPEWSWPSHQIWHLLVTTLLPSLGDDMSRTHSYHSYHILEVIKATSFPFFSHGSLSQPLGATSPSHLASAGEGHWNKWLELKGWVDKFGIICCLITSKTTVHQLLDGSRLEGHMMKCVMRHVSYYMCHEERLRVS